MSIKVALFVSTLGVVLVQATGTPALAQGADDSMTRVRLRLAAPEPTLIVAQGTVHTPDDLGPRRDSPWNGLLIGAVLGAAIGFSTYTPCDPEPPAKLCEGNLTNSRGMETAVAAALFGSIGMTVDLLLDRSPSAHRVDRARFHVTASPDRVSARFVAPF